MVASASKYTIIGLTAGQVLVGRNSVKAIKQEFQRLVTLNDSDLVVIDYNGESLVRFIGGKVLKGQNYRKFSQRGTKPIVPKAKPAPEVPAPAAPVEPAPQLTFKEREEKWIADNNVVAGTVVRIVSIPEDYADGWNNSVNDEMPGSLGTEMTVLRTTNEHRDAGIQLSDGWYWPVSALEVVAQPVTASPALAPVEPKTYEQLQADWVQANNVKVGDYATVAELPESGLDGWTGSLGCGTSSYVGRETRITGIHPTRGIELNDSYRWPFGCLKLS